MATENLPPTNSSESRLADLRVDQTRMGLTEGEDLAARGALDQRVRMVPVIAHNVHRTSNTNPESGGAFQSSAPSFFTLRRIAELNAEGVFSDN
jgi:hypothetical protein